MRFVLTTPIVTCTPRSHARWEVDAGPAELRRIAEAADRLGFHHLTCSEHVGIPSEVEATRGARYYDPLSTFGYLAAVTERIRFATHVLVLPYHHPLEVAKRYGTLDRITGGRLILGVGVGSLEEEFALLGVEFAGRGPIFEDGLCALRAVFGRREPAYDGSHYRIGGFVVDPCGVRSACRSGSAAGASDRCAALSSSATDGTPSATGWKSWRSCSRARGSGPRGAIGPSRSTWSYRPTTSSTSPRRRGERR